MIKALEHKLVDNASPPMEKYRNKYMSRLETGEEIDPEKEVRVVNIDDMVKILSPIDLTEHKHDDHAYQNINAVNPPVKGPKYMDAQAYVGGPLFAK